MKSFFVRYLPFLGFYKRFIKALVHSILPAKDSYSQYGEDVEIYKILKSFDLTESIYVDVGPTTQQTFLIPICYIGMVLKEY